MKFIDEIKVQMKAGNGGNGVVRWLHMKGKEKGGPAGGNGGRGGNILIRGIRDLNKLYDYRNTKIFKAEDGQEGRKNSEYGKKGEDLIIDLPIGSVITNLKSEEKFELVKDGEIIEILKGANGGYGNEHFKGSKNVTPEEFTFGKKTEEVDFHIELKLIADIGLVGLPNAGKSSLLNILTKSRAKIGNYEFTTLEPNLGNLHGVILADIPGLIEGASEGKGLGHKFLKHIERTGIIIHCISLENEDVIDAYKVIKKELIKHNEVLGNKEEIILLTKTDLVDKKVLDNTKEQFKNLNLPTHTGQVGKKILSVSIYDDDSIKVLSDFLTSSILPDYE